MRTRKGTFIWVNTGIVSVYEEDEEGISVTPIHEGLETREMERIDMSKRVLK